MLKGERCFLRPYVETDIERLAEIANERAIVRWMSQRFPHPYTLHDAQWWIATVSEESLPNHLAIVVDESLAGGIGLIPREGERSGVAEFGYWLTPAYWGRGIATEAARLFVPYAFDVREMRRLEARVDLPNVASARVLEKSGFQREGLLRQGARDRDGNIVDVALYGLLRAEQPYEKQLNVSS
ncbi:MAG: GNAT family N-acetyltransferase [Candidatus Eremiobacteraeota bacterium]|nr:GNAT family N-acetyltransferase [Candidatus Eremiobacteraeota bacterium]